MPNPYHDENGRFTSRKEMAAAAERLAREGRMDEALALSDELKQLEDARFDSGVSFGTLGQRLGSFFGRKPKAVAEEAKLDAQSDVVESNSEVVEGEELSMDDLFTAAEGRFAMEDGEGGQHEFKLVDPERFPHVRGFYATGEHAEETLERFEKVNEIWGLQAETEGVLAKAVLDGAPPYIPEQSRYFHNAELRESIPDLSGWVPQSQTQEYVVGEMVKAMMSQRTAAFQNAGIEADPAAGAMGLGDIEPVMVGRDSSAPDRDSEGLISNFDEGWLCAYQKAVHTASVFPFDDSRDRESQLDGFLKAQLDIWEKRYAHSNAAFDDGGAAAFDPDNWD